MPYPLIPELAIPSINHFWNIDTMAISGSSAETEAAIINV